LVDDIYNTKGVLMFRRALFVMWILGASGCASILGIEDQSFDGGEGDDGRDGSEPADGHETRADAKVPPHREAGSDKSPDARVTQDAPDTTDSTADVPASGDGGPAEGGGGGEGGLEAGPSEAGFDAPSDTGTKQDAAVDALAADAPSGDAGVTYVLIDDMEGNNGEISAPKGGNGYWFTFGDGTTAGVETPAASSAFTDTAISPPRAVTGPFTALSGASSTHGAEVSGSGFAMYAVMGFNLKAVRGVYDASDYVGFVFWGRTGSTATDGTVRFLVADMNTDAAGGVCTMCNDFFGENLVFTSTWTQYTVMYSDLSQAGFGVPVETNLNAANIYAVQFQVGTKAPAGEAFDIWVDDIYFIKP
jgi:hypothetical protein